MKNEQKFYSALENIFIGEAGQKIEGKSGYVNLMKLKSQYFAQIKPFIEKEVNDTFKHDTASREEAFQKLYTFFESYLNETGTPYFSQTPFHKNLYEKVYSEREDVSLFWKTQRLYYVKSEANYHSLQNLEVDGLTFNFDASQIEHQKNNEKKSLEFWATQLTADSVTFKVIYEDNNKGKWERLKEYLKLDKPDEIRKYLAENFGDKSNPNIVYRDNGLSREGLKAKQSQSALLITNNSDLTKSVTVEFALSNLEDLEAWAKHNKLINLTVRETTFKKAQQLYKKQNEVDYFIHKDAEGFLKEQLDMFLYQYLFGDRHIGNEWTQTRIDTIQKLKRIAHKIINYIARFEDELKHIWEKKKIVKQVNYVFTLDKLANNISLIEEILKHNNFEQQVKEWYQLEIKKEIKTEEILVKSKAENVLNENYKYFPIDTKHFPELKLKLNKIFASIDESLNGYIIKSENFQGLSTLERKFSGEIQTVYIDPPFNLGTNPDYTYKVNYKDATWLTILENRIAKSQFFLTKSCVYYVRCDSNGNMLVRMLMDNIFGDDKFRNDLIVQRGRNQVGSPNKLETISDTLFLYSMSEAPLNKIQIKRSIADIQWTGFTLGGERNPPERVFLGKTIYPAKGQHFTLIQPKVEKLLKEKYLRLKCKSCGCLYYQANDDKDLAMYMKKKENRFKFYDITNETPFVGINELEKCTTCGEKENFAIQYLGSEDKFVNSLWLDVSGYANTTGFTTENAEELIYRAIQVGNISDGFVLDFFLGSGTTIAASHKSGKRYIGIEQGEQFNDHVIPRMKKVLAGDTIGISKEVKWKGGGFFKYYELEQYEECLSRASYNPKKLNKDGSINEFEQLAYYTFSNSEKLLSAMLVDEEKEEVKVHFQTLYPEMDEAAIAETISNVSGKRIKTLSKEKVEFEDGSKIEFAKMNYDDKVFRDHYKALLWWKSKE